MKEWDPVVPTDKQVVVNGSVDSIEDSIRDLDQILHQDTIAIVFCFDAHVFSLMPMCFLFLFMIFFSSLHCCCFLVICRSTYLWLESELTREG